MTTTALTLKTAPMAAASSTALAVRDPWALVARGPLGNLDAYISATHQIPMLTPEEEQELGERLQRPRVAFPVQRRLHGALADHEGSLAAERDASRPGVAGGAREQRRIDIVRQRRQAGVLADLNRAGIGIRRGIRQDRLGRGGRYAADGGRRLRRQRQGEKCQRPNSPYHAVSAALRH